MCVGYEGVRKSMGYMSSQSSESSVKKEGASICPMHVHLRALIKTIWVTSMHHTPTLPTHTYVYLHSSLNYIFLFPSLYNELLLLKLVNEWTIILEKLVIFFYLSFSVIWKHRRILQIHHRVFTFFSFGFLLLLLPFFNKLWSETQERNAIMWASCSSKRRNICL